MVLALLVVDGWIGMSTPRAFNHVFNSGPFFCREVCRPLSPAIGAATVAVSPVATGAATTEEGADSSGHRKVPK